ncbi:hypothetical protein D3C87_1171100 [compost metagenome]
MLGIKLDGKPANVALGVGGPTLAGHGRKTDEDVGLLAHVRKQAGFGIARDVVGDGESAERARALGMHTSLWNDLAIEMREFLQQPYVLQ